MITRPFTVDEDVIRRLLLRRDRDEQKHAQNRHGRFPFRLWRGIAGVDYEPPKFPLRGRWN
jgi:hypothetical protein